MNAWELLWKVMFILTVGTFAIMAVWVVIGGYQDIKTLFERLKDQDEDQD